MLDQISSRRLRFVHKDLERVIAMAAAAAAVDGINLRVTCGVRTAAEQLVCYKNKASKLSGTPEAKGGTGISEHQYGMAVDLVVMDDKGKPIWSAAALSNLATYVMLAAKKAKIPIVWGGNWPKFVDMPHYQLDRKVYKEPFIKVD